MNRTNREKSGKQFSRRLKEHENILQGLNNKKLSSHHKKKSSSHLKRFALLQFMLLKIV